MTNKILIINDDLESCKRIKYHLQNDFTEVYCATSVHDGLEHLMTRDYTVLIMDVCLCETDGMLRTQSLIRCYTELNHIHEPAYSIVSCGSLIMNPERRTAFSKGSPMSLTRKEYDMLQLLAGNLPLRTCRNTSCRLHSQPKNAVISDKGIAAFFHVRPAAQVRNLPGSGKE